jgi:hypothetical protein
MRKGRRLGVVRATPQLFVSIFANGTPETCASGLPDDAVYRRCWFDLSTMLICFEFESSQFPVVETEDQAPYEIDVTLLVSDSASEAQRFRKAINEARGAGFPLPHFLMTGRRRP